jgi:hypothetical protein
MNSISILVRLMNGYRTYSAAILAVLSGFAAIMCEKRGSELRAVLQTLAWILTGAAIFGLRHAVAKGADPPACPNERKC